MKKLFLILCVLFLSSNCAAQFDFYYKIPAQDDTSWYHFFNEDTVIAIWTMHDINGVIAYDLGFTKVVGGVDSLLYAPTFTETINQWSLWGIDEYSNTIEINLPVGKYMANLRAHFNRNGDDFWTAPSNACWIDLAQFIYDLTPQYFKFIIKKVK